MRLPRLVFGAGYVRLWQRERQENIRLRRELQLWQDKYMERTGSTPVHFRPPPQEPPIPLIIGRTAKRRYMAEHPPDNHVPTAEEVMGVR